MLDLAGLVQAFALAPLWFKAVLLVLGLVGLVALRLWLRELGIQAWWWEYRNAGRLAAWFGWITLGALVIGAGVVWWWLR